MGWDWFCRRAWSGLLVERNGARPLILPTTPSRDCTAQSRSLGGSPCHIQACNCLPPRCCAGSGCHWRHTHNSHHSSSSSPHGRGCCPHKYNSPPPCSIGSLHQHNICIVAENISHWHHFLPKSLRACLLQSKYSTIIGGIILIAVCFDRPITKISSILQCRFPVGRDYYVIFID